MPLPREQTELHERVTKARARGPMTPHLDKIRVRVWTGVTHAVQHLL